MFKNLINIDVNLTKLFNKGKIDKLYRKMYDLAESFAIHEMKKFDGRISRELEGKNLDNNEFFTQFLNKTADYRDKRIKYHMDEMKELLKLHLKKK